MKAPIMKRCIPGSALKQLTFFVGLFIMILLCNQTHAQSPYEVAKADSLTYSLYLAEQWDDLIIAGNNAIRSGIDHYYMQMRVGIAWYSKANYRRAIPYFENAHRQFPADIAANEYLYFSYLFSGRKGDANLQSKNLTKENKAANGIKKMGFFEEIYLESGPGIYANESITNRGTHLQGTDSIYSKNYSYQNLFYLHGGLRMRISPAITVYQGYGRVDVTMNQEVDYLKMPWPDFTNRTSQNEYYGNASFALRNGWLITPAWHLVSLNYQLREDAFVDSLNMVLADTTGKRENTSVFALAIRRDFNLFALEATAVKGNFAGDSYLQAGLFGYVYPFGNLNFYTQTGIFWMNRPEISHLIFHQLIGMKLTTDLWFETSGTFGNLRNYTENNAFVVYNTPEDIDFKLEGNLIFEVSNHFSFSLRTRYMQRINSFVYYTSADEYKIIGKPYGYYAIIGGIKWKL